mmetsp:Transcript_26773/g.67363  ORF Transcript_26773/g.67363 Transcript_26773/m.67363 type:complete len:527 (+) Transcript_26773:630-2210(+)
MTPSAWTDRAVGEPLPPSTVKALQELVEEEGLREPISEMEAELAREVQTAAKELLSEKLHGAASEIAQRVEEDVRVKLAQSAAAIEEHNAAAAAALVGDPLARMYSALRVPHDLRFPDLAQFIDYNVRRATQDLLPRKKWEGPLDLDEQVERRAKEIDAEWRAAGAVESRRPGYKISGWQMIPKLPYQIISDLDGRETGILGVSCPYSDQYWIGEQERGAFWWLKNAGYIAVGISSFEHYPAEIINPHDGRHVHHNPKDWLMYEALDGFLHCQRNPEEILPAGVPRILMSESDFVMWERDDGGGRLVPKDVEKKWDFLYIDNGGVWNDYNRNYTMARECLLVMMKMGLKVVTTRPMKDEPEFKTFVDSGQLTVNEFAPWNQFLKVLEQARAMFTPSVADASPRSVTEAMSLNLPVLMNRNIVGGWKYINDKTGVFFSSLEDVRPGIQRIMSPEFQAAAAPREYIMKNHGKHWASLRLQAFLELAVGKERLAEARRIRDSHPECHFWAPGACRRRRRGLSGLPSLTP